MVEHEVMIDGNRLYYREITRMSLITGFSDSDVLDIIRAQLIIRQPYSKIYISYNYELITAHRSSAPDFFWISSCGGAIRGG